MNLGKALEALKFDNRMKDWNLKQSKVTAQELQSFDQGLEDLSAKAMPLDLEGERGRQAEARAAEPAPQPEPAPSFGMPGSDPNQH